MTDPVHNQALDGTSVRGMRPEDRFWLSSAAAVVSVAALGSLLWLLPGSPVTLWRADAALGTQDAGQAVALYDDVGNNGWWTGLRTTALRRAAAVYATELAQPEEARERLEHLLALTRDSADRAVLRERIASLYLDERDLDSAVRSYVSAVAADPSAPDAGRRLVQAARLASEAGQVELSTELWERVIAEYPQHTVTARLAQARRALRDGRPQKAHALFAMALDGDGTADQHAAARLGVATCLERLGSLDEAIAEIDLVDLPDEIRETRLDALRNRREQVER